MIAIYIAVAVDGCCLPWVNMHEILNLVKLLSHRSLCYEMNHAPSKAQLFEVTPTVGFQVEEFSKMMIFISWVTFSRASLLASRP